MIIDGSENKIPLSILKESKIITDETVETEEFEETEKMVASRNVFNSFDRLSEDVFAAALLSLIVDYADTNKVSEKKLIAKISDPVNSPMWDFEKLVIRVMNDSLKGDTNGR